MASSSPARVITACWRSEKFSISRAVDRDDQIALLDARLLRGAAGSTSSTRGSMTGAPTSMKAAGEDGDGQNEIGDGARGHDGGALPDGLAVEIAGLGLGPRHGLGIGHAGGIGIARELHIAAERNPRQFPARAVAVIPAGDLLAEADREGLDVDPAPARHEEVAELVNEHDDDQRHEEGHRIEHASAERQMQHVQEIHSITSPDRPTGPLLSTVMPYARLQALNDGSIAARFRRNKVTRPVFRLPACSTPGAQRADQGRRGGHRHQSVHPVDDAAMAGNEAARILDAIVALHGGLEQIARLLHHGQQRPRR